MQLIQMFDFDFFFSKHTLQNVKSAKKVKSAVYIIGDVAFKLISSQGGLVVGFLAWLGIRNWRTLMLVCSAPSGLIALLWFAIPESPRWLIAKGQWTLLL